MTPHPRVVDNPRQMPELRAALIELAAPGAAWEATEIARSMTDVAGPGGHWDFDNPEAIAYVTEHGFSPEELEDRMGAAHFHGQNITRWYREMLHDAQLIYVTAEMTDVVEEAARVAPDDLTVNPVDMPAPVGLVVFGRTIVGIDVEAGRPIKLDGMMWGPVKLPPVDLEDYRILSGPFEYTVHALAISFFQLNPKIPLWVPLGRSDWPWGEQLAHKTRVGFTDETFASMMEDRRLLAALWGVLNQRKLVEREDVLPVRHVRRRLDRMGHGGRDETVQIIHLRRRQYRDEDVMPLDDVRRRVGVRFPVKSFYRRQAVGPGRSERRLTFVRSHWRGPEGAPVKHVERIWDLDR